MSVSDRLRRASRAAPRPARALGTLVLALLLAGAAQGLGIDNISLSVHATSSTGSGGTSLDGMELTGSSDSDDDTDTSDGQILLQEGDDDLTSSDLTSDDMSSGGDGVAYSGSNVDFKVSDWELDVHADPFLGAIVAVANLNDEAQTFDVTLDVPVDAVSPQSLLDGTLAQTFDDVAGTLSDNAGAELYVALLDGSDVAGTELGPTPPFSISGTLSSPGEIPADSFSGVVAPATQNTIGIHWRFELAANSAALFDSSLNVVAVPEPATAVLCGVGLLGLAAAGRRRGRA